MDYIQLIHKINELNNIIKNQNEKINIEDNNLKYIQGFKKGVLESFNLFNSIIDFYNEYKNNVSKLMKEQNKLWKTWVSYYSDIKGIDKSNYNDRYNKWLFENLFYE